MNLAPYSAAFGICVMQAPAQTRNTTPQVYNVAGDVEGKHDPSITKECSTWYLFGAVTEKAPDGQLPIRCSQDLHHWKRCGFKSIPDWIKTASPETKDLWAPDPSCFNGLYHIYYAYSVFGKYLGHRAGYQQDA